MKKTISLELILALILTAGAANADFIFGETTNLGPTVNGPAWDNGPNISADGLSLFFHSQRGGGYGGEDLWVTTRATKADPWGTPVNLGPVVNSSSHDFGAYISVDELTLYFVSDRPGGYGSFDLWVTSRATTEDDWGTPENLGPTVNSSASEAGPAISADGLTLYFCDYGSGPYRPGGLGSSDLWVTGRKTKHDPWTEPVNLGSTVNTTSSEYSPFIMADGLSLYFASLRDDGYGDGDIWVTRRATTDDEWDTPRNLGPKVNSPGREVYPRISADCLMLYFGSGRSGGMGSRDLWQASITPIVDLNADGIVGSADVCMIVDHWGENYSLCDIGPTPLGDGIVDVQDLIALAEYIGQEVYDPSLIAHWALDETDGMFVVDSAGNNSGFALGDPVWQPDGGQVNGALELDGVDDFISAAAPLNPADGPFSVLMWVKGGAAGQTIISTQGGPNWLSLDPLTGELMAELSSGGRNGNSLLAETTISDGNWHRIGLIWDGLYRTLVVDGVAVAEDTQIGMQNATGGLYIGTGKAMTPGTYFSGLIDDIRIYNRAVSP